MESSADILGYIHCTTCDEPKEIKQGKGKRSRFVYGRCKCGPDQRTGVAAQTELSAFKPLDMVKGLIESKRDLLVEPNKPKDTQSKPQTSLIDAVSDTSSKPNADVVPKPNNEPNTEPSSEEMSLSKCVGIGSMIGLIFGLIIR